MLEIELMFLLIRNGLGLKIKMRGSILKALSKDDNSDSNVVLF
jgi:hypothetical protein